jgi:hypothetical protein
LAEEPEMIRMPRCRPSIVKISCGSFCIKSCRRPSGPSQNHATCCASTSDFHSEKMLILVCGMAVKKYTRYVASHAYTLFKGGAHSLGAIIAPGQAGPTHSNRDGDGANETRRIGSSRSL